jgi:hypothetical protein
MSAPCQWRTVLRGFGALTPRAGSSPIEAEPGDGPATATSGAQRQQQNRPSGPHIERASFGPLLRRGRWDARRIAVIAVSVVAFGAAFAVPFVTSAPPQRGSGLAAEVGYADFSYQANGVSAPTGVKPETSKLWFSHGAWWAVMFRSARDAYVVNKLDVSHQQWVDTGVVVDDRNVARADVLWDGTHLYVLSGGTDAASTKHAAVVSRMSFDEGAERWSVDPGYPVRLTDTGAETFGIDRDDTGTVWVAYTQKRSVYVTHSLASDRDWVAPYVVPLPEAANLTSDDIAVPVGYDGHVGIMWSDQTDGSMYFASHANGGPDREWSLSTAIQGPALADDHMSLKALRDDPAGLVFAAVKTSRNDVPLADPADPLIELLVLRDDGSWDRHVVGTVGDNQTRPLLEIDTDHRVAYVFMSAPCCSGGSIYYKAAKLDAINFGSGVGETFIRRSRSAALNNPTSTKQTVNAASGIVVLASDDKIDYYMHNMLALPGAVVAKPAPAAPAASPGSQRIEGAGLENVITDGFEAGHPTGGGTFATGPHSVGRVEAGGARSDRYAAHLAAAGLPEAFAVLRYPLAGAEGDIAISMDVKVVAEGDPGGNVPLMRLLQRDGARVVSVYRQNGGSRRIWIRVGDNRTPTQARIEIGTWARVEVLVHSETSADALEVRVDGRLVGAATLPRTAAGADTLQFGNESTDQPFDMVIDNVRVDK